jgi:hypothetical protein
MLTSQEIFNKVATHLLKQGKRSVYPTEDGEKGVFCAYRSPEGLSCAVGCLIPDELYDPRFEDRRVGQLPQKVLRACGVDPANPEQMSLLSHLQGIHDSEPPKEWASHLEHLAQDLNLTMPDGVLSK